MRARLRSLARMIFRRSRWEEETDEELRFHIAARAEDLRRSGVPEAEAERQARIDFGGTEVYKERCREARAAGWADELARNLIYAVRSMRKNRGFTAVAVLSLALGIGANAAIFSLLHRLILAKAPIRAPERLQNVLLWTARGVYPRLSYQKFLLLKDNFDVFEDLFGWSVYEFEMTADNRQRPIISQLVTGNYFNSLGIRPALGRLFWPEDDRPGTAAGVVLSHRLWRSFFQEEPAAVGRFVKLGSETYQIVGVAPAYFVSLQRGSPPDLYLPFHAAERFAPRMITGEGNLSFNVMGHVKPEVPIEMARAVLRDGWPRFSRPQQALDGDHSKPEVLVLEDGSGGVSSARREFSKAVVVLMSLVATLLLITCANLATLLFVRGMARLGEMSVRLALGASRIQLIRQWMTECLLMAFLGGATGLVLARWITDLLLLFVPNRSDRAWLRFEMSFTVVAVTLGLTLTAGLLFGLLPAIRASRGDGKLLIKEHSSAVVGRRSHIAQMLMAAQFAACLVLVTISILFTRTLWNLNQMSVGFDRNAIAYGFPRFYQTGFPKDRMAAAMQEAVERLRISPKVEAVSMGSPPIVFGGGGWGWITVAGYVPADGEDNVVYYNDAAPGYFRTVGIPFLAGRDFEEQDRVATAPPVAIVDESFVNHYLKGRNPLGQKIFSLDQVQKDAPKEIIGVVKDSKDSNLREAERDRVFVPLGSAQWSALLVRAKDGVSAPVCETEIRSVLTAVAKNVPVETGTLDGAVQKSLGRDRLIAQLSTALGLLGLLLASIGLYGTTAYSVTSRIREIGLRIALGASPVDVIRLVCRQNWWVTSVGVLIGLPAAFGASRLVESLLFGVSATDPGTLALAVALLSGVGLSAGMRPALRAARLDPSRSLRYE
jgi:putative ABC transport system permease protein